MAVRFFSMVVWAVLGLGMAVVSGCAEDDGGDPVCGDGACESGETASSCAQDCSSTSPAVCGNGSCEAAESSASCPGDCPTSSSCGDGMCGVGETCSSCASDCGACTASCGDGACGAGESCTSCAADCGACPASCGDGMCNGAETCSTCAADCGTCPASCGDGTCDSGENAMNCPGDCPCSGHTECSADQICLSGACNLAWGRSYRFTVLSAEIGGSNPDTGSAWDAFGGAPDPYVAVVHNGVQVDASSVVDDSFVPFWNESINVVLEQGSQDVLQFDMWDEDVGDDEFIINMGGVDAEWLAVVRQGGTVAVEDHGSRFTMQVEPL